MRSSPSSLGDAQVGRAIGRVRTSPGRSQPFPGETATLPIGLALSGGQGDLRMDRAKRGGGAASALFTSLLLAACSDLSGEQRAVLEAAVSESAVECVYPRLLGSTLDDRYYDVPPPYRDLASGPPAEDVRLGVDSIALTPVRDDPDCAAFTVPVVDGDRALVIVVAGYPGTTGLGLRRMPGGWVVVERLHRGPSDGPGEG